jgi:4-hydroxy-tetrahydrodipicolinate reductase
VRIIDRLESLSLVGAVAFHEAKTGRDVGEMAGLGPRGVTITTDVDSMIATPADIVLMNGVTAEVELMTRLLRSGKNVISLIGPWDPHRDEAGQELAAAANDGGVTFHGAGNMPGLLNDVLPSVLSSYTTEIESIWTQERSYHGNYRGRDGLEHFLGYGRPLTEHGPESEPGRLMIGAYVAAFDQAHHTLARSCGAVGPSSTFETTLTDYAVVAAPHDFTIEACGLPIPKGTVAGFRYEITSDIDGSPWAVIDVEHVAQVGLGPGWRERLDDAEFHVSVRGRPSLELQLGTVAAGDTMGLVELNAARMVNLIPAVVAAAPGFATYMDLPVVTSLR